mmetsp:Transcript_92498/g.283175  ORF Transcript_92498/g.283175 Transcript_92498/m.283175 type:complete len:337 (+) Transcript_92498:301-1311(+)
MSMQRWPWCLANSSGTPAEARHFDAGPFRFATMRLWPLLLSASASACNISQPVKSTWLMDLPSMMTKSILSPLPSRTFTACKQNSFSFRVLAKFSRASMRTTTTRGTSAARRKFRMSRKDLSDNCPHTAKLGFARSKIVFNTDRANPTRRPSLTVSASDTSRVADITKNSARLARHATRKPRKSTTPMAPWMMMGAKDARGSNAITGRRNSTAKSTRDEEIRQATGEVAPSMALTAVLVNDPVVGYPHITAPPRLEMPRAMNSWLASKLYRAFAANLPPTATVSRKPTTAMIAADAAITSVWTAPGPPSSPNGRPTTKPVLSTAPTVRTDSTPACR